MSEPRRCKVQGQQGTFVQYGQTPYTDEGNNPIGMRTVAIVEMDSGHVVEVPPSLITFPPRENGQ